MNCSHCKLPLTGTYYAVGRKVYHRECYARYVAPRCAYCSKAIAGGEYYKAAGKTYHRDCFMNHVALRCNICQAPIKSGYFTDAWGNRYHAQHKNDLPECRYCGRLICDALTGGGFRYEDGRNICNDCAMTAVKTTGQLEAVILSAQERVRSLGVSVEARQVRWELVNLIDLSTLMGRQFRDNAQGTLQVTERITNGAVQSRDMKISILHGLPRTRCIAVLAHELTHLWIKTSRSKPLPLQVEEGTANLVSSLVLEQMANKEALYLIRSYYLDRDPVYGDGFRKARKMYEAMGMDKYLLHIKEKGRFSSSLLSPFQRLLGTLK